MARSGKKNRYPTGNHGADSDIRSDEIENQVASGFNDQRRQKEYKFAYDKAKALLNAGMSADEIRTSCAYLPQLQPLSSDDSARTTDTKKAENRIENAIKKVRESAVEDAIAGRPIVIPDFRA